MSYILLCVYEVFVKKDGDQFMGGIIGSFFPKALSIFHRVSFELESSA